MTRTSVGEHHLLGINLQHELLAYSIAMTRSERYLKGHQGAVLLQQSAEFDCISEWHRAASEEYRNMRYSRQHASTCMLPGGQFCVLKT